MENDLWVGISGNNIKRHACPRSLMKGLLNDLLKRGAEIDETEALDTAYIDLPGMVMVDRGWETIRIDTLDLMIPTSDFEYFYESLKNSNIREFEDGTEYVKIHGWLHCIVFSVEQRDLVTKEMERMLPEVKIKAYAEEEEICRRLNDVSGVFRKPKPWTKRLEKA